MLPQGGIWQGLRQRALDIVLPGSAISFSSPPNLEQWLRVGSFSVTGVNKRGFTLCASSTEIGSALLSEAYHSADRGLEHAVTLRHHLSCGRWSSPAWTAVTFYYWGYHVAVALTRLLGSTVWYVSRALASQLGTLAGTGVGRPGPGPYKVECGSPISATLRDVTVRRTAHTRSHDAIWNAWFELLRKYTAGNMAAKKGDAETRLYLSLIRAANVLGTTWPSDLRNGLNYTITMGYGAIRRHTPCDVYHTVAVDPPTTASELIARLETNVSGLVAGHPLSEQVAVATRVLVDTVFAMDTILQLLIDEVSNRRSIDRRWDNARRGFAKLHAKPFATELWPCRSDDRAG